MKSPNFNDRPDDIVRYLILHYTGMPTAKAALDKMTSIEGKVSAHYMLDEDGNIYNLVDESKRAWHAGVSQWGEETNLNDRSIGIEIVNPGHEFGYRPFTEKQYQALIPLCQGIIARHRIKPNHVLAHSDVAPDRKEDPGEFFDWERLAKAGIGAWVEAKEKPVKDNFLSDLHRYGYPKADSVKLIQAFQRHFGGMNCDIDGIWNPILQGKLSALLASYFFTI